MVLALERSCCRHVPILGVALGGALKLQHERAGKQVQLAHRALAHLGFGWVRYKIDLLVPASMMMLVSGSAPFLVKAQRQLAGHPALYLCSEHWKGRQSPTGPAKLRLSHRSFGGPTNFVVLFGSH